MPISSAQAARVQYCYEILESVETEVRPADRTVADALKRARREIETFAPRSGVNWGAQAGVTAAGLPAAAGLPRRGRFSK